MTIQTPSDVAFTGQIPRIKIGDLESTSHFEQSSIKTSSRLPPVNADLSVRKEQRPEVLLKDVMRLGGREELDPRSITKQMLITCKVLRKRNNNVTPLTTRGGARKTSNPSLERTSNSIFNPHSICSLNEYLDGVSQEKSLGQPPKEQSVALPFAPSEGFAGVRTAAIGQRPSYQYAEQTARATTVDGQA